MAMQNFTYDHKETEATITIFAGTKNVADRVIKILVKNSRDWKMVN